MFDIISCLPNANCSKIQNIKVVNFRSEDLNCCQNYLSYFSLIDDNIKHFDKEIPVHRQEKRNKLMINGNTYFEYGGTYIC